MTDKPVKGSHDAHFEEASVDLPLNSSEIEVRLAIADFVIRRVAGTPAGREIFNGLISRFENRYPQHKLLAHYLTAPEHFESEAEDSEPQARGPRLLP